MKTKSLSKVHQELYSAWQRGEPIELQRIGDRKFSVGETSPKEGEFVFNSGFAAGLRQPLKQHSRGRHRGSVQSERKVSPKVSRVRITAIIVLAIALSVWKGYAFVTGFQANLAAEQQKQEQALQHLPAAERKTFNTALKSCLSFVPSVPLSPGSKNLHLDRDITIGGERQQQITIDCGVEKRVLTVRFSLAQGSWKVKSATPTGSRSLLSTN